MTEHLEEDDDEEDEDTRSKTNPTEDNVGVEFKDSAHVELRRSNRVRYYPDRFGDPIPSHVIP